MEKLPKDIQKYILKFVDYPSNHINDFLKSITNTWYEIINDNFNNIYQCDGYILLFYKIDNKTFIYNEWVKANNLLINNKLDEVSSLKIGIYKTTCTFMFSCGSNNNKIQTELILRKISALMSYDQNKYIYYKPSILCTEFKYRKGYVKKQTDKSILKFRKKYKMENRNYLFRLTSKFYE